MSDREAPLCLRDRFFAIDRQTWAIVDWLKAHPDAHPDERKAKMALWEMLEQEQFRLLEREKAEITRKV